MKNLLKMRYEIFSEITNINNKLISSDVLEIELCQKKMIEGSKFKV